jgi:hypothetical protein
VSLALAQHLHLVAHPLRPAYRAPPLPTRVTFRAAKREFACEYPIAGAPPGAAAHGDVPSGDADHFDSAAANCEPSFARVLLRSAEVPSKAVQVVGVVRGGALVLSPLASVQIVRPDMGHLDPPDVAAAFSPAAAAEAARATAAAATAAASAGGRGRGRAGAGAGAGAGTQKPK